MSKSPSKRSPPPKKQRTDTKKDDDVPMELTDEQQLPSGQSEPSNDEQRAIDKTDSDDVQLQEEKRESASASSVSSRRTTSDAEGPSSDDKPPPKYNPFYQHVIPAPNGGNFDDLAWFHRYEKGVKIGYGSYGDVYEALDWGTNLPVAIKIYRMDKQDWYRTYQRETDQLKRLEKLDPNGEYTAVHYGGFELNDGSKCLLFKLLYRDMNRVLLKKRMNDKEKGFDLNKIRNLGMQIANALEFLARKDVKIVHADLKPHNIIFTNNKCEHIRLIDFGRSFKDGCVVLHSIQTLNYRAPEVILDLQQYTNAIDIWSFGAILIKMHTSEHCFSPKYSNHSSMCQMRQMLNDYMEVFGDIPEEMKEKSTRRLYFFNKKECEPPSRELGSIIGVDTKGGPGGMYKDKARHTKKDYKDFENLIREMMKYEPEKRITLGKIIEHHFFKSPMAVSSTPTLGSNISFKN